MAGFFKSIYDWLLRLFWSVEATAITPITILCLFLAGVWQLYGTGEKRGARGERCHPVRVVY